VHRAINTRLPLENSGLSLTHQGELENYQKIGVMSDGVKNAVLACASNTLFSCYRFHSLISLCRRGPKTFSDIRHPR
jgi:hypothetical protein